ncbi:hypothetical protein BL253_23890 [Pseudofrankia asymbiotica]|uniref:Uncharacterized protein n=2 Tax=Pseudofrankia asymbiotica TaxID=1834516 RepID=A0A1V2I708_9ACTN|nr:hypothetical protein BL253_23890 [Pseudofrankia asymbiotica]
MASLGFFAFGAILAFAVRGDTPGIDLTAVGVIVMLVSIIGFATAVYRERWRRHLFEESVEQGATPPLPPDDGIILVEPTAPIVAPEREIVPDVRH